LRHWGAAGMTKRLRIPSTLLVAVAVVVTVAVTGSGIALAGTSGRHARPRPAKTGHQRVVPHTAPTPSGAAACALPGYPDASCTGVPAGTNLTVVTGDVTISTPNTVVDGEDIRGCVTVRAPGVVIRRSKVSCPESEVIVSADGEYTGAGLLIEDTEIDCQSTRGTAVGDTNFTARRVDIHDCENGFDLDQNATIEDSYIHNLYNSEESHTDGIQFAGGHYQIVDGRYVRDANGQFVVVDNAANLTIRHNTIYDYNTTDHQDGTSAIISNHGSDTDVLIEANLLAGGAFTLYCDQGARGVNYRVVDNHFSTAFHPKVAAYGPSTDCSDETQSGNVYHESGEPLNLT
jgi:hypothetical protein